MTVQVDGLLFISDRKLFCVYQGCLVMNIVFVINGNAIPHARISIRLTSREVHSFLALGKES